jgi:hypothetical protein
MFEEPFLLSSKNRKSGTMKCLSSKMYLKITIRVAILFLFSTWNVQVFSQNSDVGNWLVYMGNQKVGDKFNFWNEAQYRNYNFIGDLQQFLVRAGVGYDLTEKNNNVLLGYGYFLSENYVGDDIKRATWEHRIYGQFLSKQKMGVVSLSHRYRFEQRFFETENRFRYRYALAINVPLNKKELSDGAVYAAASNELFINNRPDYFDRNRLYGGVGYFFNDYLRLEVGFMNQYVNGAGRNQFQISLFNNLPLFHDRTKS